MPISSDTLFHFTNDIDNLINILEHTFRPHYCLENFNVLSPEDEYYPELELAIPMVCFCDIPLSSTKNHLDTYGHYGIGLTKEWGISHGITPVLYTYPNSGIVNTLRGFFDIFDQLERTSDPGKILLDRFYEIARYIKPYEGNRSILNKPDTIIRFYDEREWRYVPDFKPDKYPFGLPKKAYYDDDIHNSVFNQMYEGDRIPFKPSDIKFLIVNEESEILPLISRIQNIKDRFIQDEVKLLTTRILTADHIRHDF